MSAKKGLGRGFEALVPTEFFDESFDPTISEDESVSDLRKIKLSDIEADPNQPRRDFNEDALDALSLSIKEHGIIQPIVVTPHKGGYMVVAGERRFRAAKIANLKKIPAIVRTLGGQHRLELALIENLQREDLNPIETATAYLKLKDQFNLNMEEIGQRVGGKASSSINNTIRLLRLPTEAKQAIADKKLTEGQARPLIGLDDESVLSLLPTIIKENWSARRVEHFVSQLKKKKSKNVKTAVQKVKNFHEEEMKKMTSKLKANVAIKPIARGGGRIVITFKDEKDLVRISRLF